MFDALDTRDLGTVDGFQVSAALMPDLDAHPDEYECYGADDVTAWRDDWWTYVGIVVTVSREGIELGEASLWAIEHGTMPIGGGVAATIDVDAWEHDALSDLTDEALAAARETIARLCGAAS